MGAIEFWYPYYYTGVAINCFTAIVSVITAITLIPVIPQALSLKSPAELAKLNEALELERAKYFSIINSISEAIIVTSKNGTIVDCNLAAEKMSGWKKDELVSQNILMLFPEKYREVYFEMTSNITSTNLGKAIDVDMVTKNGEEVSVALSVTHVEFGETVLFCAVARDISHRKSTERQIHILLETLKTRVQSLEAFQFSVSHDLHAPLRSIEGFGEILLEDYSFYLDTVGKDYLNRIVISTKKMRQLMTDMLRLSKVTHPHLELVKENINLSNIATNICDQFQQANPHRKVEVSIQPNIIASADAEFIKLVLNNLLDNAWKFTTKNPNAKVEFGQKVEGEKTIYYVRDNGVGFDMKDYDKLFKPFSRLHQKSEFDGNGIGLTIVKQVIVLHDGEVWAEGTVGKGATFYFTIGTNQHARTN